MSGLPQRQALSLLCPPTSPSSLHDSHGVFCTLLLCKRPLDRLRYGPGCLPDFHQQKERAPGEGRLRSTAPRVHSTEFPRCNSARSEAFTHYSMTLAITGRSGQLRINKTTFNCFIEPVQLVEVTHLNISTKRLARNFEVALASSCPQHEFTVAAPVTIVSN